jgi:hypothetical protein
MFGLMLSAACFVCEAALFFFVLRRRRHQSDVSGAFLPRCAAARA